MMRVEYSHEDVFERADFTLEIDVHAKSIEEALEQAPKKIEDQKLNEAILTKITICEYKSGMMYG